MTTINRETLSSYLEKASLGIAIVALIGSLYALYTTHQAYTLMEQIHKSEERIMTYCTKDKKPVSVKVMIDYTNSALNTEVYLDKVIQRLTLKEIEDDSYAVRWVSNEHFSILNIYEETSPDRQTCPTPIGR